ncbi:MAG: AAA family ATPase [Spirochaetaceae bacterium]|jgi:ATP-dependent Clp protease ATP-binding subunit ClpC|nr:AAA family ATPase [Spirochaetaceae bacterium]
MSTLTRRAERILTFDAQKQARRLNAAFLEPEHIIYAIINDVDGAAKAALDFLQVDLEGWKRELENIMLTCESQAETALGIFSGADIQPSPRTRTLLQSAYKYSAEMEHTLVGTEHLIIAACSENNSHAAAFFARQKADVTLLRFMVQTSFNHAHKDEIGESPSQAEHLFQKFALDTMGEIENKPYFKPKAHQGPRAHTLSNFTTDLSALAKQGKLDPVVGREKELSRIVQILCRRIKNNPVLTGEPGTGKTAIVEALAQLLAGENAPAALAGKRILSLNVGSLVAGTEYRGQFEQRLKSIIAECEKAAEVILFIDEIHTIVGAGRGSGSLDAGNMLKPALSRSKMQCIGATTIDEYRKYFEKDGALERRFQKVPIEEPTVSETEHILDGLKAEYEKFHEVKFNRSAISAAARLADRYITGRNMPDKAIDLLDETASRKKLEADMLARKNGHRDMVLIDGEDVRLTVAEMTGIPLDDADDTEDGIAGMERQLNREVIGQEEAVRRLCAAAARSRSGITAEKRPQGVFLFMGQSGVGKTLLAKKLSCVLYGSERYLFRIDMSDYMERYNVSRLVGASPGYVGYDEGGVLTERVRRQPNSIILLDEVEKAHPDVFNIFLQVLEEGELEDNLGRKINFSHTIIIMTSNAGMEQVFLDNKLGFARSGAPPEYRDIESACLKAARSIFRLEFLNRLDDTIIFRPLGLAECRQILDKEIDELQSRLSLRDSAGYAAAYALEVSDAAKEALLQSADYRKMGGREIRRLVESRIEVPISMLLLQKCPSGSVFSVEAPPETEAACTNENTADKTAAGTQAAKDGIVVSVKKDRLKLPANLLSAAAAFLLALQAASFNACATGAISAEEYYSIGMAYFDIGKYNEAETWLVRASQADRTMRASEYNLGRIAFEHGRYSEAAKYFERITKGDPKNVLALKALAYTYIKMARLEDAEKTYTRVLELEPESADEGFNYSLVLFAMEKYAECEAVLLKYNYNLSENKETLLMYGRSQKAQGKLEAADTYDLWLQKNSDPQVRYEYAELLEEGGFFAKAIEQLKQALSEMNSNTAKLKKSAVQFMYARMMMIAEPENEDALKEFEDAVGAGFNDEEAVKKLIADNRIGKTNQDAVRRLLDAGLKLPEPEKQSAESPTAADAQQPPPQENAADAAPPAGTN